jgi:hypothetical protein
VLLNWTVKINDRALAMVAETTSKRGLRCRCLRGIKLKATPITSAAKK